MGKYREMGEREEEWGIIGRWVKARRRGAGEKENRKGKEG